jgi:hypothetical protein
MALASTLVLSSTNDLYSTAEETPLFTQMLTQLAAETEWG